MNLQRLENQGFLILPNILEEETISLLIKSLSSLSSFKAIHKKSQRIYGVRNLLNLSAEIKEFSENEIVTKLIKSFLGENAKIVRAIFFDKTPEANWKVPWHQDLTIAVEEKIETDGFVPWTRKANIWHVQPPDSILKQMVTFRFHLDDNDESNGVLKVVPNSHKTGRLTANDIQNLRKANGVEVCRIKRGGVLLMKPLLIHSSSAGTNPKHRRIIHFECSAENLPNSLKWYGS